MSATGGRCRTSGDPALSASLAHCLNVDPDAKLPFTHGFHAYPARLHPETARRALEAFPGGLMVDPFVGSGTTAVEAVRVGRRFIGCDISKVPLEIAWTRTRVGLPEQSRKVEAAAHRVANKGFSLVEEEITMPPWARAELEWYDPHTLREIVVLKLLIDQEEPVLRRMLTVLLSSVLIKLSKQISDSNVKQDQHFRPRPRGAAFRWFRDKSADLTKGLLLLSSDLHKRKVAFVEPELRREDARVALLPAGGVDLVLSSPPYSGVYDYSRHQARRYPIFDEDPAFAEARELGSRRDASRYKEDMERVMKNLLASLSPSGKIVLMIGDGQQMKADQFLTELMPKLGGKVAAMASQGRKDWGGGPPKQEHLVLISAQK
ncbi:MAG TPA: DNA methyltransferase [Planctomycetota bacterium]|nr:DNA methyltransferase [Planctomycetota bacterium]